ncbi:hypothetical protein [uncultured Lutibacter sp.]|uniref:hypothetical protein n=1 Tax=uncultured Lutibacter sp. TaxID=437739 RepID=UPI00261320EB|nr:hypothetical protein [uncultured Lutibacter sp.]
MSKTLNIVSFDVPYPPNYGGVIDVFYKLKALNKLGVKIILHTFEYGRGNQTELKNYCKTVYYYKREKKISQLFSKTPFIVNTRNDDQLIKNLKSNNYPILFEGLHSTYPLLTNYFNDRITFVRAHNIEHNYYKGLSKSEPNKLKKIYFNIEAYKLLKFQKILKKTNYILSISPFEQEYLISKFPNKSIYIPVFHQNNSIETFEGKGNFALYHGDIGVSDNLKACYYLIKIFSKTSFPLKIASNLTNLKLEKKIKEFSNIKFEKLTDNNQLNTLIKTAHINILPTFQNTGIKLKLINALFNGRFCLVNDAMVLNTGLEEICNIANSKQEFTKQIEILFQQQFTEKLIKEKQNALAPFNNLKSAQKIIDLLN